MGTKNKTTDTGVDVSDFISSFVDSEQKKADSYQLINLLSRWSGYKPRMWGPSIIGFGNYHYRYESGHEGDAPILGFSPRKAALSLYVYAPTDDSKRLLTDLGKFKMGKMCIYVKKLSDINLTVLEKLCKKSIDYVDTHYKNTSDK